MRSDLTDITLVVDRSGSMEEVRTDAEACVNLFIAEQAKIIREEKRCKFCGFYIRHGFKTR